MGKLAYIALGALALFAVDAGRAVVENEGRRKSFTEEFTLQDSPLELGEAYLYHLGGWLDPSSAAAFMKKRRLNVLEQKIDRLAEADAGRVGELVNSVNENSNEVVSHAAIKALGRIRTQEAADALYQMATRTGSDWSYMSVYAVEQLKSIDPAAARNAAMVTRKKLAGRYAPGHPVMRGMRAVLEEFGDEASLEALLENGDRDDVADFILRNRKKEFIYSFRDRIIPMFEERLIRVYYGGAEGFDCDVSAELMYKYAHVINVVDRTYAEKRLLPLAEVTGCTPHVVRDSLRNNSF